MANPVILYDFAGVAMAVANGVAIPAATRALLIAGTEGGTARLLKVAADGTVQVQNPAATVAGATAKILDYDTGGGTDNVPTFGILLPKAGGAVAGGTAADPIRVDPTGTTTQPVSFGKSSVATHTNVAYSASNVTLLAANAARLGATIYNDATVPLYVKLAATASVTSFLVKLFPTDYFEVPFSYTGIIDGIWDAVGSGAARVVEFTV